MKLSEQLKKMRIDKGFSQEELSEVSNLSLRTIQRLENGESSPREDTIHLLTKALDVPRDYFTEIYQTQKNTDEKIIKGKFPWFIVSLTIIGCSTGVLLGVNYALSNTQLPNDGISSIIVITVAVLFSGIGMLLGSLLEKKFNK
jgi:transcriptional regulator with XRE-family HTH domain